MDSIDQRLFPFKVLLFNGIKVLDISDLVDIYGLDLKFIINELHKTKSILTLLIEVPVSNQFLIEAKHINKIAAFYYKISKHKHFSFNNIRPGSEAALRQMVVFRRHMVDLMQVKNL